MRSDRWNNTSGTCSFFLRALSDLFRAFSELIAEDVHVVPKVDAIYLLVSIFPWLGVLRNLLITLFFRI